ncbi:MAG: GAF domain-containing sensor histidine kinase [Nitrospira sp.]
MATESDRTPLKSSRELEAAQRISETLFQHLEIDDLVELTLTAALQEVGAEAGSILLVDQDAQQLVFHHSIGMAPVPRGTVIGWDQGIAGKVFQSKEPALIRDVKENEHHFAGIDALTGYMTRDLISLPLKQWKGDPIGVLNVLNKRDGSLDKGDLVLLTIVSAFAALAIKQARLYEEAKLGEVVRLIGNIGHDLKNFLQPIVSGAWLIKQEMDRAFQLHPNDGDDCLRESRQNCDEAIVMIQKTTGRIHDRFKEIADCVKGLSAPAQFLPCKLDVVVGDVLQTLRILAADKEIALTSRKLDILPLIRADHRRLYNAFYNLVNNAIPEVPKGGSITVSGQVEDNGQEVIVSVSDTGRGIPQEIRERLFTSRTMSTKPGGTGLGTKIVKDVIDAHRGKITVESDVGQGTTFHIHLPLDPDAVTKPKK